MVGCEYVEGVGSEVGTWVRVRPSGVGRGVGGEGPERVVGAWSFDGMEEALPARVLVEGGRCGGKVQGWVGAQGPAFCKRGISVGGLGIG